MERIIILSGLSGSGKSTAAKALEDLGFFCVDNMPPELLFSFIDLCGKSLTQIKKAVAVVDIRIPAKDTLHNFEKVLEKIRKSAERVDLVFLECSDEAIVKRYKETRRIHPLASGKTLTEGISEEKRILADIRELSDKRIDTSTLSVHDLKAIIAKIAGTTDKQTPLITLLSFGYRYGVPEDADLVFDVRFLKNPHFTESLRDLDGTSSEVVDFVMSDKGSQEFLEKLCSFLRFLIPKYSEEGKSYLTLGIGCTGGRHRSVVMADALGEDLSEYSAIIRHRDINKL